MPQHSRQRRSDGLQTRTALLQAAVEVVAERGIAGVTHRAVTEKAGVPLTSASYYFSSIAELTEAAIADFAAQHVARVDAVTAALSASQLDIETMADAIVAIAAGHDQRFLVAQYETYLHATRSPAVRTATAEAMAAFERMASAALRASGIAHPERYARWFTSIVDGYQLQSLARDEPFDAAGLRGALEALFTACAPAP